jgi:hypothetical protein
MKHISEILALVLKDMSKVKDKSKEVKTIIKPKTN